MPTRAAFDAVAGTPANAADVDKLAKGWVGYVEQTADQTTSGTTPLTVTTLSTPVLASRRLKLTLMAFRMTCSVASDTFRVEFTYDGTDVIGGLRLRRTATTEEDGFTFVRQVATTTAGNKTITAKITRTAGTGTATLFASASDPLTLLIEDVGASS